MSLGIYTASPDGIVLAADSRQTYRNQKGMSRIGSDSASKVFSLTARVGLIIAGIAFLPEGGVAKGISKFVEQFKEQEQLNDLDVKIIAEKLMEFFLDKYNYRNSLNSLKDQVVADLSRQNCQITEITVDNDVVKFNFIDQNGVPRVGSAGVDQLQFIVAGYNQDGSHEVCQVYIPGGSNSVRNSKIPGSEYGAGWIGQTDVVGRIVLGFDGRIGNIPFIAKAAQELGQEEVQKQLRGLEYMIQWGTMTIQDAVDFSKLAIETTTAIQRFSDGVSGDPGDIPGVGGPIDLAVITPKKGFSWVSKKNIRIGNFELDLDDMTDLEPITGTSKIQAKDKEDTKFKSTSKSHVTLDKNI